MTALSFAIGSTALSDHETCDIGYSVIYNERISVKFKPYYYCLDSQAKLSKAIRSSLNLVFNKKNNYKFKPEYLHTLSLIIKTRFHTPHKEKLTVIFDSKFLKR